MKKSNTIRPARKPLNFPTEATFNVQLNKSLPSLAEFLDGSSVNTYWRDSKEPNNKDCPPPSDQNLKVRTHHKVPSKRLALLLDAYSDRNIKKQNYTIDRVEASRRDPSIKSPQNTSEDLRKSAPFKQLGAMNVKTSDFLKSREFSKLAVSKVLNKGGQRAMTQEKDIDSGQEVREPKIGVEKRHSKEDSEQGTVNDPAGKRPVRMFLKEEKKLENTRNSQSKLKGKLRQTKLLYTDSAYEEKTSLNSSQPQSTKNQSQGSRSMFNSVASPLLASTGNSVQKKDVVSNVRLSTAPGGPAENSKVQLTDYYYRIQPRRNKDREKEKHKKTFSTSTATAHIDMPKTSVSLVAKDLTQYHKKGVSRISELATKPQSETDRELVLQGSVELPKGIHKHLLTDKDLKVNITGSDMMLLSEPVRHGGRDSKQEMERMLLVKSGGNSKWEDEGYGPSYKKKGTVNQESFETLENAFRAFLEDHVRNIGRGDRSLEFEAIIKAWNAFRGAVGISQQASKASLKEESVNKRVLTEPEVNRQRKEFEKNRKSPSPCQVAGLGRRENSKDYCRSGSSMLQGEGSVENMSLDLQNWSHVLQEKENTINKLRRNEEKMMRLVCAIRNQGYDVERIYREEVKRTGDDFMQSYEFPDIPKLDKESVQFGYSQIGEESVGSIPGEDSLMIGSVDVSVQECHEAKVTKECSDTKSTTDSTPFPTGGTLAHNKLNPVLKNKLRLDFTGLNPNNKENMGGNGFMVAKLDLNVIKDNQQGDSQDPHGFHEEFMAKIEEFSLSWRQAAMNQRNF